MGSMEAVTAIMPAAKLIILEKKCDELYYPLLDWEQRSRMGGEK
jgi:hypothetical protein